MKTSVSTPQSSSNGLQKPFISEVNKSTANLANQISKALGKMLSFLSGSTEIRVSQALDSNAQIVWHVYDPFTDSKLIFSSETEVRVWLEQRYR